MCLRFSFSFPFFFLTRFSFFGDKNHCSLHCSRTKNIKNESHDTIHIFKNYFATVFSVSAKISCIQTNPIYISRIEVCCSPLHLRPGLGIVKSSCILLTYQYSAWPVFNPSWYHGCAMVVPLVLFNYHDKNIY